VPVRNVMAVAVPLWLFSVGGAFTALVEYKNRPGAPAAAPLDWPRASSILRTSNRPKLVLIAHPRCPCTRATLHELSRLTARLGNRLSTTVLFVEPSGTDARVWEHTALIDQARAIPGVDVMLDRGGVEAQRFGALTSGQALLYRSDAKLAFAGGLTTGRGHEGDSPGAERIFSVVAGAVAPAPTAPVFGCALAESQRGAAP
jgi:hypothetical protein